LRPFQGRLAEKTIAVWGLAFKPGTDDIREAPAMALLDGLLADGARLPPPRPYFFTSYAYKKSP